MKIIKKKTDFAQRVQKLMQYMIDNKLSIRYMGGSFRISDTDDENKYKKDCILIDGKNFEEIQELPALTEYKLKCNEAKEKVKLSLSISDCEQCDLNSYCKDMKIRCKWFKVVRKVFFIM